MKRTAPRWLAGIAAACLLAATPAGCGDEGAAVDGPTVTLRITRDFGRELLSSQDRVPFDGHRTGRQLLTDYHEVGWEPAGYFVTAIDGLKMRREPEEFVWVTQVNGIESDTSPVDYRLYPGDIVQFDYRYWHVSLSVRATVGAFPETFTRGAFGRRFPVIVHCQKGRSVACLTVRRALLAVGVDPDGAPTGDRPPKARMPHRAHIFVGAWNHWRDHKWAAKVEEGPEGAQIFARFSKAGDKLHLLDWRMRRVRTEGAGTGLLGAYKPNEPNLVWFVTGVDDAGVERAARALTSEELRDAFAAVVTHRGVEEVPLSPASSR